LKLVQQEKANPQCRLADYWAGILAGEGEIDLGSEEIKFLLVPKSKHPRTRLMTKLRGSDTGDGIMDYGDGLRGRLRGRPLNYNFLYFL
jgi:hypothetical protein